MIIGTLFSSVVCHAITLSRKKLPNSLMSKYKTKVTPISYITEAINTSKCNVRQARQIKDSPSSFEDKIKRQKPENITSDLPVELSYFLIDEFSDVFANDASIKRLNTCKNVDEYESMVRSFHARLALFV